MYYTYLKNYSSKAHIVKNSVEQFLFSQFSFSFFFFFLICVVNM
jgi:hypothetical protein